MHKIPFTVTNTTLYSLTPEQLNTVEVYLAGDKVVTACKYIKNTLNCSLYAAKQIMDTIRGQKPMVYLDDTHPSNSAD